MSLPKFLIFSIKILLIFLAFYFNQVWAQNIMVFWAWFLFILTIIIMFSEQSQFKLQEDIENDPTFLPSSIVDVSLIIIFAAYGWFITAFALSIHELFMVGLRYNKKNSLKRG